MPDAATLARSILDGFDRHYRLFRATGDVEPEVPASPRRGGNRPWAELLKRTFGFDVLTCPCLVWEPRK
jgi:hypothetical protein